MMRAFTSDVKVIDRTRVCVLLVLVFICSIDRSSSVENADKTEGLVSQINASDRVQSVPISPEGPEIRIWIAEMKRVRRSVTALNSTTDELSFRHPRNLTKQQVKSAVTIEFNFMRFDKKDRAALNAIYREVRRKILEYLNRMNFTTASPTSSITTASTTTIVAATSAATTSAPSPTTTTPTPTTAALPSTTVTTPTITTTAALTTTLTTSVVEATTDTPTTAATTAVTTQSIETSSFGTPPINRKRKRRNSGGNNDTFTEDDLPFVDNDPEFDENGNLIISIFIDKEGFDDLDLLYNAINALNNSGELQKVANTTVEKIYRGLPEPLPEKAAMAGFQVWLPILLAIILLLIIFIFVYCWKATNKKVKDDDRKKIIPPLDSKPSTSNGNAPPKILDDNHGWLVPMAQYSNEEY